MNKLPAFYNGKGQLTKYGLACGYIEKFEGMGQSVELYMESGCIHVRQFNHVRVKRVFWESFDHNLTDARARYTQAVREVKSLCYVPA